MSVSKTIKQTLSQNREKIELPNIGHTHGISKAYPRKANLYIHVVNSRYLKMDVHLKSFNMLILTLRDPQFEATGVKCKKDRHCARALFKDGLPYLFHSFRNKYFNKISLGNMLYFQNKL